MVNHPNRNAATIDTLRSHLIPVRNKIKKAEFSKIDKYSGERIILEVSWKNREVFVTVVKGGYGPRQITDGEAESFEIQSMFTKRSAVEDQIGYTESVKLKEKFYEIYQQFILGNGLAAQEILDKAPPSENISEEIKMQIRSVLNPYLSEYIRD